MVNFNPELLKVPLGFIRLLELLVVIIAFASAANFASNLCWSRVENLDCNKCITIQYPLSLSDYTTQNDSCNDTSPLVHPFHQSMTSSSQFFVFVGVMSMLYILGSLAVYTLKMDMYETDARLPIVDLVITGVFCLLWFCASCAFAAGVTGVKQATDKSTFIELLKGIDSVCAIEGDDKGCKITKEVAYANLTIAALAGFLSFFVFAGNVWFVLKETNWYKERRAPQSSTHVDPNTPSQPYP